MNEVETIVRSSPKDPPCPKCGRRYAVKGYRPGARVATLYCDPDRSIGGCGAEFHADKRA